MFLCEGSPLSQTSLRIPSIIMCFVLGMGMQTSFPRPVWKHVGHLWRLHDKAVIAKLDISYELGYKFTEKY